LIDHIKETISTFIVPDATSIIAKVLITNLLPPILRLDD